MKKQKDKNWQIQLGSVLSCRQKGTQIKWSNYGEVAVWSHNITLTHRKHL